MLLPLMHFTYMADELDNEATENYYNIKLTPQQAPSIGKSVQTTGLKRGQYNPNALTMRLPNNDLGILRISCQWQISLGPNCCG